MSIARCLFICALAVVPFAADAVQHVRNAHRQPQELAPEQANTTSFAIGDKVRARGLLQNVVLNGEVGSVVDIDSATGRYLVRLTNDVHRIKSENLELLPQAMFAVGTKVRPHDLVKTPSLNGAVGTVVEFDSEADRYLVSFRGDALVSGDATDVIHRIKTEHLESAEQEKVPEEAQLATSQGSEERGQRRNAFDVEERSENKTTATNTSNATILVKKPEDPCKCLSFAQAYKKHNVTCGQTFEYSRGSGARAMNIDVFNKTTPQLWSLAQVYGKEFCQFFTNLDMNSCLVSKYQARPEMKAGSWCYVSDKCEKLNGGAPVPDSAASWKDCDPAQDTFLSDWRVEDVLKLSKLLDVNAGLLTGFAYPAMSMDADEIQDGSAKSTMNHYRQGLPVVFNNNGALGDKQIVDGYKTWKMSMVKVDGRGGLWKSTCKTEDGDCTPSEIGGGGFAVRGPAGGNKQPSYAQPQQAYGAQAQQPLWNPWMPLPGQQQQQQKAPQQPFPFWR